MINKKKFKFSIVMSVYNVEEFIDEAVKSIISQDIGFLKNVQIIMVNDGSSDKSGEICDYYAKRYPNNIKVIHKENGGLSSARNEGLKHVEGEFINFFDPDDILTKNTLSSVYRFFTRKYEYIDMVAIPLHYFDAKRGEHPTNLGKFNKGNRIIDLGNEYTLIHNSVASSFFKYEIAKNMHFDENLCAMEDAKAIIEFLIFNPRYGVVSDCKYMYRQRTVGSTSLSHGAQKRKNWYSEFIKQFSLSVIKYCLKKINYVPNFVQAVLLYDLHWKIEQEQIPDGVLTEHEMIQYRKDLYSVFNYIDDELIMSSKWYYYEHKALILSKKYKNELMYDRLYKDLRFSIHGNGLRCLSNMCATQIDQLKIIGNTLILDANTYIIPCVFEKFNMIKPIIKINGDVLDCEVYDRKKTKYVAGEEAFKNLAFKLSFDISKYVNSNKGCSIEINLLLDDILVKLSKFKFSDFCAISDYYKNQYCLTEKYIYQIKDSCIIIESFKKSLVRNKEKSFQKELWNSKRIGERKAVIVRKFYWFFKRFKRKKLYLITDRINKADDNGEAMFNFYNKNPEFVNKNKIKYYYVIDKKCADYQRIKNKRIIQVNSIKHKFLHLLADNVLSSHADNFVNKPIGATFECYRDFVVNQNFIFLQHGITQNDISGWLNKYNKNIKGFVTAAKPETKSLLKYNYYYSPNEIWELGFARFDRLYNDEKKYITIMPTWRKYLMNGCDESTGVWRIMQGFKNSNYYNFYNSLINDYRLIEMCKKHNYVLCFMPHPNIIPHINIFNKNESVKFFGINDRYTDIYAQSNLVLTDYSSAAFDFAYLRKPIIYAQFDFDEFFKGDHVVTQGYFDYKKNGFGDVAKTVEETVNLIISYIKADCKLKDKYRKRIDNFFAFNDRNNCKRIAERIIKLDNKNKR